MGRQAAKVFLIGAGLLFLVDGCLSFLQLETLQTISSKVEFAATAVSFASLGVAILLLITLSERMRPLARGGAILAAGTFVLGVAMGMIAGMQIGVKYGSSGQQMDEAQVEQELKSSPLFKISAGLYTVGLLVAGALVLSNSDVAPRPGQPTHRAYCLQCGQMRMIMGTGRCGVCGEYAPDG